MDQRFPKRRRLRSKADIDKLFRDGRRLRDGRVTLVARPNGLDYCRMGVAVATTHGRAVRRNRLKRLCREALRTVQADLPPGWDLMVLPRHSQAEDPSLEALKHSIVRLARHLPADPAAEETKK